MRKALSLCLTAFAAVMFALPSFAEGKDVTNKLYNADCEALLDGWGVTFTTADNLNGYLWKDTNHTESYTNGSAGYWGFKGANLECWGGKTDGYGNPVGANSISQMVTNLPNGTYVFGAFAVATIQVDADDPTKDDVEGVYMFANDTKVTIATNDPAKGQFDWGHGWKFNVATVVTDGTLKVGLGCEEGTTASFVAFDNATLFFFGDVTTDDALTQMRQIDLQCAVAAADSLTKYPMAAETLAVLNAAIAAAQGKTTIADCEAAEETVRLASKYARVSIHDYQALVDMIAEAKDVLTKDWTQESAVANLQDALTKAEADLAAGAMDGEALEAYLAEFKNAIDLVRIDDLYTWMDILEWFANNYEDEPSDDAWLELLGIEAHPGYGDEVGQYPGRLLDQMGELFYEASLVLQQVDALEIPATEGIPWIAKIKSAIFNCIANVNKEPTLPLDVIFIPDPNDPEKAYVSPTAEAASCSSAYMQTFKTVSHTDGVTECFRYESPFITLPYPVDKLVMTVLHTAYADRTGSEDDNNPTEGPFFNISEFFLYDADGEEVKLIASDFNSNAKEPIEGSYEGLCDKDLTTFFHSIWSSAAAPAEFYHNLQITMPENMLCFKIAIEIIWGDSRLYNMPTEVIFSGLSNVKSDLAAHISNAEGYGIAAGDEPGFNSGDFTGFFDALAKAKEVFADQNATDAELAAAIDLLEENMDAAEGAKMNLPELGKVYQLSNQAPFVSGQGKVKNMTVFQDSILWWADADPADEYQNWVFESVEKPALADESDLFYAIKNVKTGKYIGQFTSELGEEGEATIDWGNPYHIRMSDTPCPIYMRGLGLGQVHFWSNCAPEGELAWYGIHALNHNGGTATENTGDQGGGKGGEHPSGYSIQGVCGAIGQWETGVNGASAWYIRQLEELPLSLLVENGFGKKPHHLYTPVQFMTISSEKPCNYDNLQITDILGQPFDFTVSCDGYNAAVDFGENYVESFYLSFDGDVDQVTITGGTVEKPMIAELQGYYDYISGVDITEGTEIGMFKDVSGLNAAMAAAKKLIENGGTDEEITACLYALLQALDELEVVMPEAGKNYFIVNAFDTFQWAWGAEMAMYANALNQIAGWTYISIWDACYQWQFQYVDDETFKLYNVGTANYLNGTSNRVNDDNDLSMGEGVNYQLVPCGGRKFAIMCVEDGQSHDTGDASSSWFLHPRNHGGGYNCFGTICFWGHDVPTKSEWYIREAGSVQTGLETISAEPASLSVFSEGTYDLTGRRVENPEKGLYIINGQKVLVK